MTPGVPSFVQIYPPPPEKTDFDLNSSNLFREFKSSATYSIFSISGTKLEKPTLSRKKLNEFVHHPKLSFLQSDSSSSLHPTSDLNSHPPHLKGFLSSLPNPTPHNLISIDPSLVSKGISKKSPFPPLSLISNVSQSQVPTSSLSTTSPSLTSVLTPPPSGRSTPAKILSQPFQNPQSNPFHSSQDSYLNSYPLESLKAPLSFTQQLLHEQSVPNPQPSSSHFNFHQFFDHQTLVLSTLRGFNAPGSAEESNQSEYFFLEGRQAKSQMEIFFSEGYASFFNA